MDAVEGRNGLGQKVDGSPVRQGDADVVAVLGAEVLTLFNGFLQIVVDGAQGDEELLSCRRQGAPLPERSKMVKPISVSTALI